MTLLVPPLEAYQLRKIWSDEARHFTPWLKEAEPLARLGKALGIGPLEYVAHEHSVGAFSADIVARDPWGGSVIIENQLEATDHTHLGQAVTYAAGVEETATIVWVAARIRPEHATALRWMNGITPAHVGFYGVEIKAWSINGSGPGYQFDVVVRPDVHKLSRGGKSVGPLTAEGVALQDYWAAFRDYLDAQGAVHWMRAGLPRSGWWGRNLGRPGANLYAIVKPNERSLAVSLEVSTPTHATEFAALSANRDEIDRELGGTVVWSSTEARDYITTERKNVDLGDRAAWSEQHAWLLDQLERYRQVFRDRDAVFDPGRHDGNSPEGEENQDANS